VSQRTNEPLPAILLALIQPTSEPNPDAFSHPDDVVDMISVARRTERGISRGSAASFRSLLVLLVNDSLKGRP